MIHTNCLDRYTPEDVTYASETTNFWNCPPCLREIFPLYDIDDNDTFFRILSYNANPDHMINENLIFDPFDTSLDNDTFDDIDPDKNNYNTHPTIPSKYTHTDALNKILIQNQNLDYFSIFHLNIRSTKKNIYDVKTFLTTIDHKFSVIAFTETWLQSHNLDLYNLENYNMESSIRTTKLGGGVSIYIKNDIQYKSRNDLNYSDNNLEMIWTEIDCSNTQNSKNKIIGCIYIVNPVQTLNLSMKNYHPH